MGLTLYPENATIEPTSKYSGSTDGQNTTVAKNIIRIAVGLNDGPMEAWQLINIVAGHLTKDTQKQLKPLRGNNAALVAKVAELGIPQVSGSMTEEERLDAILRAKNNQDLIGHSSCKSLKRGEIIQCIKDVIAERQPNWTYPDAEPVME